MSKEKNYKFEVIFLTPMAQEVSELMNKCYFPGEYGYVKRTFTFKSSTDKFVVELRDLIKDCYEQAGVKVLSIHGGEII